MRKLRCSACGKINEIDFSDLESLSGEDIVTVKISKVDNIKGTLIVIGDDSCIIEHGKVVETKRKFAEFLDFKSDIEFDQIENGSYCIGHSLMFCGHVPLKKIEQVKQMLYHCEEE